MRYWGWFGLVAVLLCAGCATHSEGVTSTALTPPPEDSGAKAVQQALAEPVPAAQHVTKYVLPHATGATGSSAGKSASTPPQGRAVQPAPRTSKSTTEQGAYKNALAAYESHRAVEAEKQFDAFMAAYPTSKLAPNALYWKAECLYLRGKYADALFVFKDVTARYPKHPKAADALLKAGMSYARLGDADSAKLHYRVLYEDYPTSQAAKTGKKLGLNP